MNEPSTAITYQIQYQEEGGKPNDWFIMTGRHHDESFRSAVDDGMHEISSMDEAVEIAEALVNGYSHPHKRSAYYWRPIVAARVCTIIRAHALSAVYGTPNVDVSRETEEE